MDAAIARRLRPSRDADLVEQRFDDARARAHLVEADAGLRVEIDAQLVGVGRIVSAIGPHMEAETAEIHCPHDVGEIRSNQRAGSCAVRRAHGRRLEPLRNVVGHSFLEER